MRGTCSAENADWAATDNGMGTGEEVRESPRFTVPLSRISCQSPRELKRHESLRSIPELRRFAQNMRRSDECIPGQGNLDLRPGSVKPLFTFFRDRGRANMDKLDTEQRGQVGNTTQCGPLVEKPPSRVENPNARHRFVASIASRVAQLRLRALVLRRLPVPPGTLVETEIHAAGERDERRQHVAVGHGTADDS